MTKELAIKLLRGSVLGTNEQLHEAVFMAIRAIKAEPVKRARWIKAGENLWDCSECGQRIFSMSKQDREEFHKWCGRCGAKMDEVEE